MQHEHHESKVQAQAVVDTDLDAWSQTVESLRLRLECINEYELKDTLTEAKCISLVVIIHSVVRQLQQEHISLAELKASVEAREVAVSAAESDLEAKHVNIIAEEVSQQASLLHPLT